MKFLAALAVSLGLAAPAGAAADQDVRQIGALQFKPCTIGVAAPTLSAWCASLAVPENYDAPGGRHIDLHVAFVPSQAATPAADWVTYLDGGPGGAATETWPALQGAFAPLLMRRNVVLVDQRGTGASHPLKCDLGDESDDGEFALTAVDLARMKALFRACATELSRNADLRYYTTTLAVEDLEQVRRALGAPRLDVIGVSYGTRVAQRYAARHPASVRSVVLDGVVPNRLALPAELASNLDVALKAYAALCQVNTRCRAAFGDSYLALHRLLARLRAAPVATELTDPITGQQRTQRISADMIAGAVRLYAYTPLTAALLPAAVRAAESGNFAPLLGQSLAIAASLRDRLNQGMAMSVSCSEDADLLPAASTESDTVLGDLLTANFRAACEVWPRGARPKDFHAPFRSSLPALVLSGEHDPVTPARYGAEVAAVLPNARALVARGQGHGVLSIGCMPRLVAQFVEQLRAARLDASCLNALGDTPAVLDLNGAGP